MTTLAGKQKLNLIPLLLLSLLSGSAFGQEFRISSGFVISNRCEKSYKQLRQEAIDTKKPLMVWVGIEEDTQKLAKEYPQCLHYFCQVFWGVTAKDGPQVVVGMPVGSEIYRHDLNGRDSNSIRAVINGERGGNLVGSNGVGLGGIPVPPTVASYPIMVSPVNGFTSEACSTGFR